MESTSSAARRYAHPADDQREVLAAQNPAGDTTQDRVFILPNAALVLDGASDPNPQERDGGRAADTLGRALRARIEHSPRQDLRQLLREAIAAVTSAHGLVSRAEPRRAPSRSSAGTRRQSMRWSSATARSWCRRPTR